MRLRFLLIVLLATISALPARAQYTPPGGGAGGGVATTVTQAVGASKVLAEYQFKPTETCAAAVDYSGNGNSISSTAGVAPLIIPVTGGCNLLGNGALITPAAVQGAQAITVFFTFQSPGSGGQVHNSPVTGNGGGGLTGCNTIDIDTAPISSGLDNTVNGAKIFATANGGTVIDITMSVWNGTGVLTASWGTTQAGGADDDKLWINGVHPPFITTLSALRSNNTHPYQIGGAAAGSCIATQSYLTGKIYWVVFWATEPTDADEATARNFIVSAMANRNVNVSMTSTIGTDQLVLVGDSITAANGLTQSAWNWVANNCGTCLVRPNPQISNLAVTGYNIQTNMFPPYKQLLFPYLGSTNGTSGTGVELNAMNIFSIWAGTNDGPSTTALSQILMDKQSQMCRDWKLAGGNKCMIATMISRTTADAQKNTYDPVILNSWPLYFDAIIDYAANPLLGADGANAANTPSGWFLADSVHPNQQAEYNLITPYFIHVVNSFNANPSFSAGNVYSSTNPAAVAVTAATESTNTMTFTTAANTFALGNCVTVTGVTPAGYNTPTNACWTVLTAPNNTTFTAYNGTTGLGALSVAGTAAKPQETDIDAKFSTLGQCTTCTHTLEPCTWHLGQTKLIKTTSTSAWTVTPWQSSETINGGATLTMPVASATNQPTVRFEAIRGTMAAGGCTWSASIQ